MGNADGLKLNAELHLDGSLAFLLVGLLSIVGDPSWTVVFRLNFDSLTASDGTSTVEVFGTLDATVETLPSGDVLTEVTTEVSTGPGSTASSLLHFEEGFDFIQLTLFSASFRENADGSFVVTSQGTLESSFIGGTVTFATMQDDLDKIGAAGRERPV